MCFDAPRGFIKDLKDLENGTTRFSIDIKDLKDLKRHLLTMELAGDRPPRYRKIKTRRARRRYCIETRRSLLLFIVDVTL